MTSYSATVCTASGLDVSFVGVGTCSLTTHVAEGADYLAAFGHPQNFAVDRAVPTTPTHTDLPVRAWPSDVVLTATWTPRGDGIGR